MAIQQSGSILENLRNANKGGAARTNTTSARGDEERKQSKLWLNAGHFNAEGKFVNLPIGLAIDTMEPLPVRGQSPEWVKLTTERNMLIQMLQEIGDAMEPGEEKEIPLTLVLRRVGNELVVDGDEVADMRAASPLAALLAK